jgi:hypothetical protein
MLGSHQPQIARSFSLSYMQKKKKKKNAKKAEAINGNLGSDSRKKETNFA